MKFRPIMFSTLMIQALPHKTQTRRTRGLEIVNKHPDMWNYLGGKQGIHIFEHKDIEDYRLEIKCPYGVKGDRLYVRQKYGILNESLICDVDIVYGLTDDRLYAILLSEVQNGRYKAVEWSLTQADSNITERRLYGGVGRSDLLTDKILRLWAQGLRGLVSAKRTYDGEIPWYFSVSSEQEGYKANTQIGLHGFPRDATVPIFASSAFGRNICEQSTRQSSMGDSGRELDGQESSRAWMRRRKASDGKIDRLRDESVEVGNRARPCEPTSSSEDTWDDAVWNIRRCPSQLIIWEPAIHMFHWMSRHLLELVEEPIPQRLWDITEQDAIAEGVEPIFMSPDETTNKALRGIGAKEVVEPYIIGYKNYLHKVDKRYHYYNPYGNSFFSGDGAAVKSYASLWDSLNVKKYPWSGNYWAWRIPFEER